MPHARAMGRCVLAMLALAGSSQALAGPCATAGSRAASTPAPVWHSQFSQGVADWPFSGSNWGDVNRSYRSDPDVSGQVMAVFIAQGSVDPATMVRSGRPAAGQGMKLKIPGLQADAARLSFKLKLPAGFLPGLGGKLGPGLCGGACNGGGRAPNGSDGWSTRLGFDGDGNGTVYTYLPGAQAWGRSIGKMALKPGAWMLLEQEVQLNTPGQADGHITLWADGRQVIHQAGLLFRNSCALAIDGLFFDSFYGGQSPKFAAPRDTTVEFAELAVHAGRR